MWKIIGVLVAMAAAISPGVASAQTCNGSAPCVSIIQNGPGLGLEVEQNDTGSNAYIAIQASSQGDLAGYFSSSNWSALQAVSYAGGSFSAVYGLNNGGGYGVAGRITPAGSGYAAYGDNNSSTGWAGYFNGRVWVTTGLDVNGTCVSGSCSSDVRLKKNIRPLNGALSDVVALEPVTFEWKDTNVEGHAAGRQVGFIAQDVEKVIPEWVAVDDKGFKTVDRDTLPMLLVGSIKTLKVENDELRARVKTLEETRRPATSGFEIGLAGGLLLLILTVILKAHFFRRAKL